MKHTIQNIRVRDLELRYGSFVVQSHIGFEVPRQEIFAIVGGSGCGKSTLLKYLIGLREIERGEVFFGDYNFRTIGPEAKRELQRRFGVLYQSGALWSSLTVAENIALPLSRFSNFKPREINEIIRLKLSLVGLAGFEDSYPREISGGMRKRAGLARALALDPDILFFDEPHAGLDPVTARRLDDLILQLREGLRTTVVLVTHELDSLFAIADRALFLDADQRRPTGLGNPREMRDNPPTPEIDAFLNRKTL